MFLVYSQDCAITTIYTVFHHTKWKSPSPRPLATTSQLFFFADLPIPDISYK